MDGAAGRHRGRTAPAGGPLRLTVREGNVDVLVYVVASVREAAEIRAFIGEFFPRADYILEPLLH